MASIDTLLTDHLDLWTSAIFRKSTAGRGRSKKFSLHGIEKLRALILGLAVCGKLVPQDPNDEPASELLKRIKLESGKATKSHQTPIATRDEPLEVPSTWLWVRLGETCILENGDRGKNYPNKSALTPTGVPFVNAGHLQDGRIDAENITYVPDALFNRLGGGKFKIGDILFCLRGSLGKAALVTDVIEGAIASSLVIVRFSELVDAKYGLVYFTSSLAMQMVRRYDNGTAQPNLSSRDLGKFLFPLPPLAEQHRIVAKVDELLALCDRLEAGTYDAIEAHQLLVKELLATLTASRDAGELAENWARLETHFDTLFITEDSIDQLKQTILQLAVMGRLVPQDPKEEPASDLLKRIRQEIANYATAQGTKPLQVEPMNTKQEPFLVPNSWCWTRLSAVFNVITDGDHQAPPKADDGIAFLTIGNITTGKLGFEGCRFVPEEYFQALPPYRIPANGDILYTVVGATYGRPALVETDRQFCVQRHIAILKPVENMNRRFLVWLLSSQFVYSQAAGSITGTAQPTVPLRPLRNFIIPLPPLAEQGRIVAKIDQLMELCDGLRTQLAQLNERQVDLADAVVAKAVG